MDALVITTVVIKTYMFALTLVLRENIVLRFNSLGMFPGTIAGSGLMSFTFKLLPTKEVPSTGTYRQSFSK
jgi:hypothetical protein